MRGNVLSENNGNLSVIMINYFQHIIYLLDLVIRMRMHMQIKNYIHKLILKFDWLTLINPEYLPSSFYSTLLFKCFLQHNFILDLWLVSECPLTGSCSHWWQVFFFFNKKLNLEFEISSFPSSGIGCMSAISILEQITCLHYEGKKEASPVFMWLLLIYSAAPFTMNCFPSAVPLCPWSQLFMHWNLHKLWAKQSFSPVIGYGHFVLETREN